MSYAPGAPTAVWSIPSGDLGAGVKLTLMYLWSKADHEIQRDPRPTTVWVPKRYRPDGSRMKPVECLLADIAEGTGAAPATVKKHLTKLNKSGLAMHDGRCVDLVPPILCGYESLRDGAVLDPGGAIGPGPNRSVTEPSCDATAPNRPAVEPDSPLQSNPPDHSPPPKPGEDAPATPSPESETRHAEDARAEDAAPANCAAHPQRVGHTTGQPGVAASPREGLPVARSHRQQSGLSPDAQARHAALVVHRDIKPDNGRADLAPEVWDAINTHGYSMTAESRQWRKWLLGCMDSEDLTPADVVTLLVRRNEDGRQGGAPTKDRLWSWGKPAKWRESVLERGKPQGSMSGGLTAVAPIPQGYVTLAEARRRKAHEGAA